MCAYNKSDDIPRLRLKRGMSVYGNLVQIVWTCLYKGCYNGIRKLIHLIPEGANVMRLILRLVFVFTMLAALCASACGQVKFDLQPDNIRVDTEHLCYEIGVRVTGTPEEVLTADWIESRLRSMGYSMEDGSLFRTGFKGMKEMTSENLGVVLNPDPALPLMTVVAHYDTVATSTGARDNSASVAILLEMARFLADNGPIPGCELRLVFLGSEENGYHGARAYARSLSEHDFNRHIAAFNMDISAASPSDNASLVMNMVGGKNADGKYVEADFLPAFENTVTRYVSMAHEELLGTPPAAVFYFGQSDHVAFNDAGLEAANICWRNISENTPMIPKSYHTMEDTPEELDYSTAVTTGRCILRAIEMIAADVEAGRIAY